MKKQYTILLVVASILLTTVFASAQNYILQLSTMDVDNGIQLSLKTHDPVSHEIVNFDSRETTLIKIFPLTILPEVKEDLLASFIGLGIDIQVLELSNNIVIFALKNVLSNRLFIKTNKNKDYLKISILEKRKITKPVIKSNAQLSQESYQKAIELFEKREFSQALGMIRSAIKLNPDFAEAYFLGGQLRFELHDWKKAKFNFQKAVEIKGEYSKASDYLNKINTIENDSLAGLSNIDKNSEDESDNASDSERSNISNNEKNITSSSDSLIQSDSSAVAASIETLSDQFGVTNTDANPDLSSRSHTSVSNAYVPLSAHIFDSTFKNYLQLGFFLLIISFMTAWILYLKKNRTLLPMKNLKKDENHFNDVLGKIQKKMQKEIGTKKSVKEIGMHSEENRNIASSNKNRTSQTFFYDEFNEKPFNSLPYEGDPMEKIYRFSAVGYSVEEIARMLNMGKGEVELILNFRGRHSPMTPPNMRFNLAETA